MSFAFWKKRDDTAGQVDFSRLPRHIAIILDGNGRWAKRRGLPRSAGHKVGAETFRTIATYCRDIGIEYLTVYAFSTENWKRPEEEVSTIMELLKRYLLEPSTPWNGIMYGCVSWEICRCSVMSCGIWWQSATASLRGWTAASATFASTMVAEQRSFMQLRISQRIVWQEK